tara:strand:+ start:2390 stop:3193 length:804 start_codon:yes stop_codon:yes gene_type:complete
MNLKIKHSISVIILLIPFLFYSQNSTSISEFEALNSSKNWKKEFKDCGTGNWKDKWFLDGEMATITNSKKGMHFSAGPEDKNDVHHAVLWTKESFEGDLKMEFDYTKTDTVYKNVTILYIQATGNGKAPFEKDITKWNHLRKIPSMRTYFNNMNALHISYAAFDPDGNEYIRARRYPTTEELGFKDLVIEPSYDNLNGLFKKNVTYHITVIKSNEKLFFKVDGNKTNQIFTWDLTGKEPIVEGRIGLRHMFTRSALYKNFKIYSRKE